MFDHSPRSNCFTSAYLYCVYIVQVSDVHETEDRHSEVMKAARSLFYKRTRTLYRWVYANMTKCELNRRVKDAWNSASENEKNIYISEVIYFHNNWQAVLLSFHTVPHRNYLLLVLINFQT
jgi:hypothetical protein